MTHSGAVSVLGRIDVSRETEEKLRAYEALVRKWSPTINLVAAASLNTIWQRHIVDSAQLVHLAPPNTRHWADLGSGAGFPGLVVAVLLQAGSHATMVTLLESDQRKATFLRTCVRELSLDVTILAERIEEASPLDADIVSARALAPLPRLIPLVHRHLAPDGMALLPIGQSAQTEIDEARKTWHFQIETSLSHTQPAATILRLERISRA